MNYFLHATLLLAACYLYYRLALRRETFFRLNRWLLLGGMAASFLLPLVTVPASLSLRTVAAPVPTVRAVRIPAEEPVARSSEVVIAPAAAPRSSGGYAGLDWSRLAWMLYLGGVVVLGVQFFYHLLSLGLRIYRSPGYRLRDLRIVETEAGTAPFSFWNRVFIHTAGYDPATRERILDHERVHVREKHSIDLVLAELLIVVQWCNPFAWLYRRAIENNLEYLTDAEVLRGGADPVGYQLSLLQVAVPHRARGLVTNYNQHFLEQRIKMMKTKRSSNRATWKYLALPALLLFSLSSFNAGAQQPAGEDTLRAPAPPAASVPAQIGVPSLPDGKERRNWTAEIDGGKVCFSFIESGENGGYRSNTDRCFEEALLGDLPRGSIGAFSLTRASGTLTLRGMFDGNEGLGTYDFTPAAAFEQQLSAEGYDSFEDRELLHFFLTDITGGFLDYLQREDLKPDHDVLVQLAVFGLNQAALTQVLADLAAAGYGRPALETIVQLRIFDINKAYINALAQAGYDDLELDDVIQAKIHGLSLEFIAEMAKLGYADVDFDQIIQMAIHRVDTDYAGDLAAAGYRDLAPDEIIAARIHHVRPEEIRALQAAGLGEITLEEATQASIHGVDPEFVSELSELGFKNLSLDDIISAKIHGVSASKAKEMQDLGLEFRDMEEISSYSIHGVTAGFVRGLRELGYTDLNGEDYVAARIHGVTPEFITAYADLGYGKIPFERLVELRIHNVTPDFIEKNRREGDTLEDLIDYSIMRRSRR